MKNNWKLICLISGLLMLFSTLPYFYGYLVRPTGTTFLGTGFFHPGDLLVYYSYIEQAKDGHWLFKDMFTAETDQKPFINLLWLTIGGIAKIFSLNSILAFHLARLILIPVFVFAVYKFLALVFRDNSARLKLAMLLFFFSGGFGGLVSFFQANRWEPLEIWWPEAYSFFSIYHSPHFIASWTLIVGSFYFLLKGYTSGRWRHIVWAGLLATLACQFHSFYLALFAPISMIFAVYQVLGRNTARRQILRQTFIYNLFLLPVIIYYGWFFINGDSVLAGRLFDNLMSTPSLWYVLFAFGFISFLALIAIGQYLRSNQRFIIWDFLVLWAISLPILLYAPLPFQRRLVEGWQLPMVILATIPLQKIIDCARARKDWLIKVRAYIYTPLLLLLFGTSTLIIWFYSLAIYHQPGRQPNFYLSDDLGHALAWLKKQGKREDILLAAKYTGLMTPFWAGKTAYWGHAFETIKSEEKWKNIQWFFANNGEDEEKKLFLKQTNVKYLVWGQWEKQLGNFQPETKNYLEKIYDVDGVQIYKTL